MSHQHGSAESTEDNVMSERDTPGERRRLAALERLRVLDTPPESVFDGLAETAALVCGVPISLISLLDVDRQWFKASIGLPGVRETPREHAFCSTAILDDQILEVPDASVDDRFADNPLVVGDPNMRFYAGAPLCLSDGSRVGTLCVIDRSPGRLTPVQRTVLAQLAGAAVKLLEARRVATEYKMNEVRFQALSESSPLGVFSTDANGACTYTNARWRAIFGLGEEEAYGSGWMQALHPDDRADVLLEAERAAKSGVEGAGEFRIARRDGSTRHLRALWRPTLDEHGTLVSHVGSVEDITERKAEQLALRRSEALLTETGALADIGGWELDLASEEFTWSDQTCRIHGLEPGHRPQLADAMDFYPPEAQPRLREAVERAMSVGERFDLELPFIRADGCRIWVRAVGRAEFEDGVPVRLLGAIQNVTRQMTQRHALESAHERMTLATDSGGIGIWEWSIADATLDWTPRVYELFDMTPGKAPPTPALCRDRVHPEDRARLERATRAAVADEGSLDVSIRILLADGEVRHLCVTASLTHDADGKPARLLGACWDVSPLRAANEALTDQRELLHVTLQSIGDAVITTDLDNRVTWLNPAAEQMTGWRASEANGKPLGRVFQIIHEDTRLPAADPVTLCLRAGRKSSLPERTVLVSRDGREFGIEDSASPLRSASDELLGAVLVFHDVSEQRRLTGEMTYRATHDALTGLVNRTEMEVRLERVMQRSGEDGVEHALVYIDLDQFKLVNDACGHAVGDELLRQVSALMLKVVRKSDTLARIGGDEFAVIFEDCPAERAKRIAQTICEHLDDFRFAHDGQRFRIGASIGLVSIDGHWPSVAAAMQAADISCYAAKEAGRNRVHVWFDTDESLREHHLQARWAPRLERALDEDLFVLYAQRIAAVSGTTDGVHAEVLIRLRDDEQNILAPGAFLPSAERFHLATRIDRWVLNQVISRLESLPDLSVVQTLCVNVSGQSLGDRAFHEDALNALERAGPDVCRRLCLEITETAVVTNMSDAVDFAERVRALGVGIALDDFGAGASSFGYLKNLPADVLKIDGQYIRTMIDDALADAAVRCFVDVARLSGIETVAEFVDRAEVLERVEAIGIDHAQGFLLHEPESLESVLGMRATVAA